MESLLRNALEGVEFTVNISKKESDNGGAGGDGKGGDVKEGEAAEVNKKSESTGETKEKEKGENGGTLTGGITTVRTMKTMEEGHIMEDIEATTTTEVVTIDIIKAKLTFIEIGRCTPQT